MPDDFIVDQLFRANEHHLIFGPSGAGTTTLLLQILSEWRASRPILEVEDFIPHPAPFCLVSCAKSVALIRSQMRRLGLDPRQVPLVALPSRPQRPEDHTFPKILTDAMDRVPDLKVIFLDGLTLLCDKISDDRAVAHFMGAINEVCGRMSITVVSTIRAGKARTGEGYISIRERIVGSGSFASQSDAKIGIEPLKPSEPLNASRAIYIFTQDQSPRLLRLVLSEDGFLPADTTAAKFAPLDAWLASLPPGTVFLSADLASVGEASGISRASIYRWRDDQLELGSIAKVRHGEYRVVGLMESLSETPPE